VDILALCPLGDAWWKTLRAAPDILADVAHEVGFTEGRVKPRLPLGMKPVAPGIKVKNLLKGDPGADIGIPVR